MTGACQIHGTSGTVLPYSNMQGVKPLSQTMRDDICF